MNLTEFEIEVLQRLTVGANALVEIASHLEKLAACTELYDEKKPELGRVFYANVPDGQVLEVNASVDGSVETTDADRVRE